MYSFKLGQGSVILRVKIPDSTATTGAGKTGLTSASSGLIISTIADNEAAATAYTVAATNVESISTLGTFAAPTAGKCRFKEVDATNHKGIYEIQIADARWAVSGAKSLIVSISGATGAAECDAHIPLTSLDPYDAVRGGLTALPNAAAQAAGGLYTRGTGAGQIAQDANGRIDVNIAAISTDSVAADNLESYCDGTTPIPANTTQFGGANGTFASGRPEVNTTHFSGTANSATAGVPHVDVIQWRGVQPNNVSSGRVDTTVGAMQADVVTASAVATDAIGASELASDAAIEIANAIKAAVVETDGSRTLQQVLSVLLAFAAGQTTNSGNTFLSPGGAATRIAGTTNGNNERTSVTLTPSA
jgi:hypothetical protein